MPVDLELELSHNIGEVASIQPIPGYDYTKSGTVTKIDITITENHITIFYLLHTGDTIREDISRKTENTH